ncbi:hypothetical protein HZA44_03350 [Candidatus Peregrinibacteria bacterium]|nr:hypothetical protein [Candidatus Peregrinibacteria bacterium]
MKKFLIPLIAILFLAFSLIGWGSRTQSASNLPYPEPVTDEPGLSACKKSMANQIYLMRSAYNQNVTDLLTQEKPTSEMVDESFEALRTYRCWLDYACYAVLYSANADPEVTKNSGGKLLSGQIRAIPGCAKPENIEIPGTQIQFIPACKVTGANVVEVAHANYVDCQNLVEQDFADIPPNPSKADVNTFGRDQSPAYISLERALKANSAEQQIRPLRDKFESLLLKMQGMEGHMTFLKEQLLSLDTRMACYCSKCD